MLSSIAQRFVSVHPAGPFVPDFAVGLFAPEPAAAALVVVAPDFLSSQLVSVHPVLLFSDLQRLVFQLL
jgi:hypothetical protein